MTAPAAPPDSSPHLAAEYVMGLLEGDALAEATHRESSDPSFADEVNRWRARFSAFDHSATPVVADASLWSRIEAALSQRADASARPGHSRAGWWSNLTVLRTATLTATAATLVQAIGLGFAIREARQQPQMVAVLMNGEQPGAVVHAFSDGRVVLVPLTGIPVPQGRALEVWTLPSKERGPVSVGLMSRARTLPLQLKDLPAPAADQLFEITLEPASGSPTGRPTGPILFKGNTARTL